MTWRNVFRRILQSNSITYSSHYMTARPNMQLRCFSPRPLMSLRYRQLISTPSLEGCTRSWCVPNRISLNKRATRLRASCKRLSSSKGLLASDPIGALARLQLGRAYGIAGNMAKAKMALKEFLSLWNDADPEIPIYKQAKAEYARLQ